jgi:serine protease Do
MTRTINLTRSIIIMLMTGLLVVSGLLIANASPNAPVPMIPENFSSLADTVSPAIVHIRVEKTVKTSGPAMGPFGMNPFGNNTPFKDHPENFSGPNGRPEFKQPGLGSGFVIDKDGYVVTNNHVVEGADKIKVVLKDEREYDAKIVGRDPVTDIALLKVDAKDSLPTVALGSSDNLKVGEWVMAIGSPFGLDNTVTAGIVSAKGRVIGSGPYDDFIQTDASINPGNSGGPLLNMKGEVVGINTMIIAGGQGIGFAIPIDMAEKVIKQLKQNGEVTRGWFGVSVQDVKGDLAEYYGAKGQTGVLVAAVTPGDPAEKAGIKAQDIITEVNGKKMTTSRDLTTLVAGLGVGDRAEVKVLRGGEPKTLEVEIGKRPLTLADAGGDRQQENDGEYGFQVSELTPEMAERYNLGNANGIIVVGVQAGSKADKAGVEEGDLILEVNHGSVASVSQFKKLLDQNKKGDVIKLLVKRMNAGLLVIHLA